MKRDLDVILSEIRKGEAPPLLLLHGDDFQVHAASRAILDLLVPAEKRAFNLEQFDGRSSPWDQIRAALMTPPLFAGKKAVFIENAPYFLSREQKGELGEKVSELWRGGKKDEAAKLFLDLLLLEGWSQDRWEALEGPSAAATTAKLLPGDDKEVKEDAEGILSYCRGRGMSLSRRSGDESHSLMEFIEAGLPPWNVLLMVAPHVDRRTRLYKKFAEKGAVLDLDLKRDRSGRVSRESLAEYIDLRLREAGKKIEPQAREMILLRAGEELWAVHQELEKLLLYIGQNPWIRAREVDEIFLDQGEAWIFDLTNALAERDSLRALEHLARMLSHGDHPLKLLGIIAAEVRRLLIARHLIEGEMRGRWNKKMTYPQFQAGVLSGGSPLITRSPYRDYMSFQKAENFATQELLLYLDWIYQTDLSLKSSGNSPRMAMERLILEMCRAA
jgi:DNA polymerase-3 subunit delta